jgi:hypothetical protein
MTKFNPKWLEEKDSNTEEKLVFYETEKNIIEKNGRKTLQAVRKPRPLKEEDLLNWHDYGDKVVMATKNGKKYTIKGTGRYDSIPSSRVETSEGKKGGVKE